jgi:hypothetical protein
MKKVHSNSMRNTYSLGNYEKQVLLELDIALTSEECQRLNALWPDVRNAIEYCYDGMFEVALCKMEVKKLLRKVGQECP